MMATPETEKGLHERGKDPDELALAEALPLDRHRTCQPFVLKASIKPR
jgi:hypothetical protein